MTSFVSSMCVSIRTQHYVSFSVLPMHLTCTLLLFSSLTYFQSTIIAKVMRAKAYIIQSASMGADNPPLVLGQIEFAQIGALVFINGTITRLTDGEHGFHIHTNSDCVNGSSIHFNPNRMTHGAQSDTTRHIGDLGNILAMNGSANINMTDTLIKLSGPFSIIGRSIVIHAMADDLGRGGVASSLTSGNSGVPVACGVIGIVN